MVLGPTSLAFLALAVTSDAFAIEPPLPAPWNHLGANLAEAFGGTNLVWHGAAIASTVMLAESGGDYEARTWVRRNVHARGFADASVVGGYVLPAVVAPGVYAIGLTTGDRKTAYAGAAAVQSLTVTVVTVGMLKWGTGRPFPNNGRDPLAPDALDHPEDARLAALEPFGEHWITAWPSGHTAATMSIAAALYGFAPEHAWLGWVGYPLALAFGAGMIVGDHHWASDVVAGGMLGHAVGYSTGRGFRRAFDGSNTPEAAAVHPVIRAVRPLTLGAGGWGLGIAGTL
jgi:membrane-associated phospholipid phosphatase